MTRIINQNLLNIKNYALHYGANHIKALSEYNLAIIEPKAHHLNDIKILQNHGSQVYAYLSVFEIPSSHEKFKEFEALLLSRETKSSSGETLNRNLVDLRSEDWMGYLFELVKSYAENFGFDGIFVDTLSYIEEYIKEDSVAFSQILAVTELFNKINEEFPHMGIIQNNGLGLVLNYTKNYIDGVCWENPDLHLKERKKINKIITGRLKKIKMENNLKIFLLTQDSEYTRYYRQLSYKNSFIYYDAPKDYIGPVR